MTLTCHPACYYPAACTLLLALWLATAPAAVAQNREVLKFERLDTEQGLSQNNVQTILCDHKGFLWFGTWDGLNRYDGREFKVFKVNPHQPHALTNNRITQLWQDRQHVLWVRTYDGYLHYFVRETQEFMTYPDYLTPAEAVHSIIACTAETSRQEVLLGSTHSGVYYLRYDTATHRYHHRQLMAGPESGLTDNTITCLLADSRGDCWVGTPHGLNYLAHTELNTPHPRFIPHLATTHFTISYQQDARLLFGIHQGGLITYDLRTRTFDSAPAQFADLCSQTITCISHTPTHLLLGTQTDGLYIYRGQTLQAHHLPGQTIQRLYVDHYGTLWVNTKEFGIYQIDAAFTRLTHYNLVPPERQSALDDERQFIYEDRNHHLWIALHAGGLALFNRRDKAFTFYRHVPNDHTTISSDNVYCITEDQSGLLWIGTGHTQGGVNKVYTTNPAFTFINLEDQTVTGNENVVRALMVDNHRHTWVGTKAGHTYILNEQYQPIKKYDAIPLVHGTHPGQNAYALLQDKDGYIWIGTKGAGVFVSSQPLADVHSPYDRLRYHHYTHDPDDSTSLSGNLVYSLLEDSDGYVWVGTYDGGVTRVHHRSATALEGTRYTTANTALSSNKVRCLTEDHARRVWIATAFGLNVLSLDSLYPHPTLHTHLYDPRAPGSLSYNDVIHVYHDRQHQRWLGTLGGGVNKATDAHSHRNEYTHLTTRIGLINDVIYGILEDASGHLWFSTDHGISRYDPLHGTFENFDRSNHLHATHFNENTCTRAYDGTLLFGTHHGLLRVTPDLIAPATYQPPVVFTNFQLFNKDVDLHDPAAPLAQDIETLDHITLHHQQSSFSITYAALSFFAPDQTRYAFKLAPFDPDWNYVGNQTKATYTNLAPGTYTFTVKAASHNGHWSVHTGTLTLTILPPWWQTPPLYFLYLLTAVVMLESVLRGSARYHELQNDLQVEKRVNDIKLQFFTNISHEIRTPLTLILGPIQDLMAGSGTPLLIRKRLQVIEKNTQRMLRLINQLLDFRKIQQEKMTLKVQPVELRSFLQAIIENFNLMAEHQFVHIQLQCAHPSLHVWLDPHQFDSVVFNILANALKFSPRHSQITLTLDTPNAGWVAIAIRDEGPGFPPEKAALLFQHFTPLSAAHSEWGGSGLGLALSYQIMKLHQGDIMVDSQPGEGAVFTITLRTGTAHLTDAAFADSNPIPPTAQDVPRALDIDIADDALDALDALDTPPDPLAEKEHHLMIVEDHAQIVQYLKETLQRYYRISVAMNGTEALQAIQHQQPDMVITDVMMPGLNGLELTQHLKKSIDTSHIPVVILTARCLVTDQIEGIESGAEAYILKPFNMTYVQAVVRNLLRQRHLIRQQYIHHKPADKPIKITSKDDQFLATVNQMIQAHYADPDFNIDKLARNSHVSRTVFYHKIKALTGLTPIDFLRQKRLRIASQIILETDYTVAEVATITGFNDVRNFSKRFKEVYKLTPTQYKQHNNLRF